MGRLWAVYPPREGVERTVEVALDQGGTGRAVDTVEEQSVKRRDVDSVGESAPGLDGDGSALGGVDHDEFPGPLVLAHP